ncbi:unnamed protein product [Cuscuta epithymum]|uniref:Uncharacterized protein n=1 Tax=Cuscuta epithymum TaxID=186058 RepID=A0AAV0F7U2_9ASTE|nr:unnamed protein product [Cuscuta epithymum]
MLDESRLNCVLVSELQTIEILSAAPSPEIALRLYFKCAENRCQRSLILVSNQRPVKKVAIDGGGLMRSEKYIHATLQGF